MRTQPPDFGLSVQPLNEPPFMLSCGCEDHLLNGQDAHLCTLKFIDPPLFLTRMAAAAAVGTPVYLIEHCFPQADGDLKINAGPESATF